MRTRTLELLATVAFLLAAGPARALDAPHDQTFSTGQCDNCHALFVATPSGKKDTSPGCVSCHNALATTTLGFPWTTSGHQAVPGQTGNQHNWSGYAVSATHGAQSPPASNLQVKLIDGKLQCAVCHDIHTSSATYAPNKRHTSIPIGTAQSAGGGTLTLTTAGTASKAWRIKVVTGSQFIISHDFGLATPSWFNFVGGNWVAGTDPGPGKSFAPLGSNVTLDDGVTTIQIAGAPVAGVAFWDFYVSYPALRASNVSDGFCYQCHAERVMNHVRVSGNDPAYQPNGSRKFSHPVSVALGANGHGYDRLQADVLDADGSKQPPAGTAGGDGRAANDLAFDGTMVRCTTCHAAHNAASNSLTSK